MLLWISVAVMLLLVCMSAVVGISICNLLPYRIRPVGKFFFSPLLGLATFVFAATLHGWLLPFSQPLCIAEALIITGIAFYYNPEKRKLVRYLPILIAFALVCSLNVFYPLLRFNAFNPFNDAFTYLVHGQWLQQHPFSEPAICSGYYPSLTQIALYQVAAHRMGASFFLGWAQALCGLEWSYYAYPAVITVPFVSGSLAVGGAIALIIPGMRLIALLSGCLLATLFNGFTFGSSFGFFPQTFGLAFAAGSVNLFVALIVMCLKGKELKKISINAIPVSMLFAAFAFCYNDLLMLMAAGVALFIVISLAVYRSRPKMIIIPFLIVLGETILLINFEFIRIYTNFINTVLGVGSGSHRIGWPVIWTPAGFLANAFGMRTPIGEIWYLNNVYLSSVIVVVFLVLILYFLFKTRRSTSALNIYINLCMILIFVMAFILFRYFTKPVFPEETGATFLQFKVTKWASPFCFILLGASLAYFSKRLREYSLLIPLIMGIIICAGSAQNYFLVDGITNHFLDETGIRKNTFDGLLKMKELVKNINENEIIYINLGHAHHKLRQMVAYILYDRKLASNYADDGYLLGKLPPSERNIPFDQAQWLMEFAEPKNIINPKSLRVGNLVLNKKPEYKITLETVTGGYGREVSGKDWWYWTPNALEFRYKILGNVNKLKLQFGYMPANNGQAVKILIKTKKDIEMTIYMKQGWNEFETPPIDIDSPEFSIIFSSKEKVVPISQTDRRMVSFLIKNLEPIAIFN